MNLIEFKNVNFSYAIDDDDENQVTVDVLKNFNLTIEKGSFVAILGHNGSGKSTTAKLINGINIAQSGEVIVDGQKVVDDETIFDIRRKVGMVFQNPDNQIVSSIVEEDVAFGVENLGVEPKEIRKRVDNALKTVGMYEYRLKAPNKLSGGQKQRVAFARALAPNPNLLLLDEPFAAIDAKVRQELRSWLKDMIERLGVTSIFVTHDQSEAIEVADEIIITNKGRIEQIGSPIDIYQHPKTAFSASFFGQTTTLDDYTKFKTFDVVDNVDRAVIRPEFVKVTKLSETTAQKASVSVGEVIKTSFRGDNIEIAVKCDGGTVYAYRGLDETPITVGEKVNVFLYRLFITKGDEVQILRNKSLQEESVII